MSPHQRWAKSSALIVPFSSSNIYYNLKHNIYILYSVYLNLWLTVVLFVRQREGTTVWRPLVLVV